MEPGIREIFEVIVYFYLIYKIIVFVKNIFKR